MGNVISRTEAKIRRHTHIINSVDMNGLMSLCVCIYILNVACIKKTHAKFKCIESSTHICIYEFIFGVTTAKFSKSIENFQANCKKKNPNFPIYVLSAAVGKQKRPKSQSTSHISLIWSVAFRGY